MKLNLLWMPSQILWPRKITCLLFSPPYHKKSPILLQLHWKKFVHVNSTFPELQSPNSTKAIKSSSVSSYKLNQGIQRLIIVHPCQISLYLKILFFKIMLYPFIVHFNSVVIATKNRGKKKLKSKHSLKELLKNQ